MFRRTFLRSVAVLPLLAHAPQTRAARVSIPDIVVLIPGIGGSTLRRDDRDVWAPTSAGVMYALTTLGRSINALAVGATATRDDVPAAPIVATGLFPDVHLIPGLWKVDGYTKIRSWLFDSFELVQGENFFEFPYDWRLDNRLAAKQLQALSRAWLENWRAKTGRPDAKVTIVAHSMGGLIARHFVEVLGGWRVTSRTITFGTPYRGSLKALNTLANGIDVCGVRLDGLSSVFASFDSVYQLLPTYPCIDTGDGVPKRVDDIAASTGLSLERVRDARAFHRAIDDAHAKNADDPVYREANHQPVTVVGTNQPTLQSAVLRDERLSFRTSYPWEGAEFARDGDGTVSRISALPFAHRGGQVFIRENHGSMQNSIEALLQLDGQLGAPGAWHDGLFRGETVADYRPPDGLSLTLWSDVFAEGARVEARVASDAVDLALRVAVVETRGGRVVRRSASAIRAGEPRDLRFDGLSAGMYRLTVGAEQASWTLNDVFAVVAI